MRQAAPEPATTPLAVTGVPAPAGAGQDAPGIDSAWLSMVFLGLGMAALAWTVARSIRRARARPRDDRTPAEQIADLRRGAAARGRESLDSVMADATELAQRLAAQLDAKAARLEQLIEEADERLARLEGGGAAPRTPAAAADPVHARVHELADRGLSPVDIARETGQPTGQVELILALRRRA